jgi:2-dehydro-3-deoxyphosphogalactonate aldolase
MAAEHPGRGRGHGAQALIGAGTVLQEAQVDRLAQLGARLVVTPMCSRR